MNSRSIEEQLSAVPVGSPLVGPEEVSSGEVVALVEVSAGASEELDSPLAPAVLPTDAEPWLSVSPALAVLSPPPVPALVIAVSPAPEPKGVIVSVFVQAPRSESPRVARGRVFTTAHLTWG